MRTLALETSTQPGSVAILAGEMCLGEAILPAGATASVLFPTLQNLLQQCGLAPIDIELLAVTLGPGSFTGTRIGVTFAKTWAYARGIPVCGVMTPEVLAAQVCEWFDSRAEAGIPGHEPVPLWTVLDAQRRELFVNRFDLQRPDEAWQFSPCGDCRIVGREDFLEELRAEAAHGPQRGVVTGSGLTPLRAGLESVSGLQVLDEAHGIPNAETLGRVAARRHRAGQSSDVWRLAPLYLRKSAAEEKWDARQKEK